MAERYRTVLLFGAPGVGKGTQGKLLGGIPGYCHVATGDIFRGLDKNSELGRVFLDYSTRGELVPDDVTIRVFQDHVGKCENGKTYCPRKQLLVLDGIPRTLSQCKILANVIDVLLVLHLVVDDEAEMMRRMMRRAAMEGRHDDAKEEVIRHRWEVYRRETFPILEHFGRHKCVEIKAVGSSGRVLHSVLGAVVPVQEHHFRNALEV